MDNQINKLVPFFRLALEKDLIEPNMITKWADNEILSREISLDDNFIFELSLGNSKSQLLNILDDEIDKRKIGNHEIEGKMFLNLLKNRKLDLKEDVLNLIDDLLELNHLVHFTKEKKVELFYVDECRDEYMESLMDFKSVKKALHDFIWK